MGKLVGVGRRLVGTLIGWGGLAASCLAGALAIPPTLLLARFWPGARERFYDFTRLLLRLYVRSLLVARFEVDGDERRLEGPRILVANHQSWLDPLVLIALEPRLAGPARRYLHRVPLLGGVLRLSGFYESEAGDASLEALHRSAEQARARGSGLLFFPEGTRSRTGELGPFHRGAFRAAVDHDLPIQPVVIEGLDRVLPPGHWMVQHEGRYPVRIRYLPPVRPPFGSGLRRDVVRALCERVRGALVDGLAELRAQRAADVSRDRRRPRAPGP